MLVTLEIMQVVEAEDGVGVVMRQNNPVQRFDAELCPARGKRASGRAMGSVCEMPAL